MRSPSRVTIGFACLLIGIAGGVALKGIPTQPHPLTSTREVRAGTQRLTNPLLECDQVDGNWTKELQPFKGVVEQAVAQIVERRQAKLVAIYFRDLNNGPWFGINEREEFTPASLLKLPTMMGVLRWAEVEPQLLERTISFASVQDSKRQHFQPSQAVQPNTDYTVLELTQRMIRSSDNTAARILRGLLGDTRYLALFDLLGVPATPNQPPHVRVKDYAGFFRVLFNASYLQTATSEFALQLLTETEFTQGLVAGVPTSTPVAHKFGEAWESPTGDHQLHDCGIIYHPERPYLLCIMTRGDDFGQLARVIAQLSRVAYENVDQQVR